MELTDKLIRSYMDREVNPPCISLYIPTHIKSTSQRLNEDRIRFKNALQDLEGQGVFAEELTDTHAKLVQLIDDNDFWLHQSKSLAIFADADGYNTVRLPFEVTPMSYCGERFIIGPMLVMQGIVQSYYLLDIDLDRPALYEGSVDGLREVQGVKLPGPIDDVIETQQRRSVSGERGGAGGGVMYYGRGEADDTQANDTSLYLQLLAAPVDGFLKDKSDRLFLAGSPKVVTEFRSMLQYDQIVGDTVSVNHNQHRLQELHEHSLGTMLDIGAAAKNQLLEQYASLEFDLQADGMAAVKAAAEEGRVDTLLVPLVRVTTDGVDDDGQPTPVIELPEYMAELDEIIQQVARQSGEIVPVEQADFANDPSPKAILRY